MSKKIKKGVVKKSKKEESELEEEEDETVEDDETTDDDIEEEGDDEEADDESDDDEAEDDDDDGDSSSKTIDYKKIADAETARADRAEQLIIQNKINKKKKKDDAGDDEGGDDDEDSKPLTKGEMKQFMATQNKQNQRQLYGDRIKEIATEISESVDEANAIIAVHSNRTWPDSVSLRDQVEEASAIVNRKRSGSKISELTRALKSKGSIRKGDADGQRDGQRGTAPKMSKADESAYKSAGFIFDNKTGYFKKKLPSGKKLVKDPKTKRSWTE
jgi:hypothetical protein